jgi:hypothetical protein
MAAFDPKVNKVKKKPEITEEEETFIGSKNENNSKMAD